MKNGAVFFRWGLASPVLINPACFIKRTDMSALTGPCLIAAREWLLVAEFALLRVFRECFIGRRS